MPADWIDRLFTPLCGTKKLVPAESSFQPGIAGRFLTTYPVGAELVTEALRDIPQFALVSLTFNWQRPGVASRRVMADGGGIEIFEAAFDQPPLRSYPPSWDLSVFAVPRTRKAEIHAALLNGGLPKVRDWLRASRADTWYEGRKRCLVVFDLSSGLADVLSDG